MKLVYLVGVPGSGKTTALDAAVDLLAIDPPEVVREPVPHVRYGPLWYLGVRREAFGGTDALSMSISPKAVAWLPEVDARVLVGEGDRLATPKFLLAAPQRTVIWLDTPVKLCRERAAARAAALGRPEQEMSWWKGRVTKVTNLVARVPHVRIDGDQHPLAIRNDVAEIIGAALRFAPADA